MLSPLLAPSELSSFSSCYSEATEKFVQLAEALPLASTLQRLSYAGLTPSGAALETPYVWIGPREARQVLVLMSAVHGVEGYSGSAIQVDLLRRLSTGQAVLPEGLAVVMVHAVNAWGFAWGRRVDEQGIDVNRNFVDFTAPPNNDGYASLAKHLVPDAAVTPENDAVLAAYRQAHGQYQYELAVSGGQYQFPDGLFYGGTAPSQARINLERVIADVSHHQPDIAVLDLHTGLGPYGHGELICDHPEASAGLTAAQRWYGNAITMPGIGESCSVPKTGLVDYAWHEVMGDNSCYITLEYGTFPITELLGSLREDHRINKPGMMDYDSDNNRRVRERLIQHFYPAQAQWQTMVLLRARQVIQLACVGLAKASKAE